MVQLSLYFSAEEMLPGGAAQMISQGVLKNPNVNIALAQHVYTELDVGKVGFRKGQYMASTDEIYINVEGQNGHAAIVEGTKNPISVASQLVYELNSYFKKRNPINIFFQLETLFLRVLLILFLK